MVYDLICLDFNVKTSVIVVLGAFIVHIIKNLSWLSLNCVFGSRY